MPTLSSGLRKVEVRLSSRRVDMKIKEFVLPRTDVDKKKFVNYCSHINNVRIYFLIFSEGSLEEVAATSGTRRVSARKMGRSSSYGWPRAAHVAFSFAAWMTIGPLTPRSTSRVACQRRLCAELERSDTNSANAVLPFSSNMMSSDLGCTNTNCQYHKHC